MFSEDDSQLIVRFKDHYVITPTIASFGKTKNSYLINSYGARKIIYGKKARI